MQTLCSSCGLEWTPRDTKNDTGRKQCHACRNTRIARWKREHYDPARKAEANRTAAARYAFLVQAAKRAKQPLTVTPEQHQALLAQPCHYCGLPLNETGTGLDRREPGGPYSLDNVVPACWFCNAKKAHLFTYDEMRAVLGPAIRQIRLNRGQ